MSSSLVSLGTGKVCQITENKNKYLNRQEEGEERDFEGGAGD